jgi:integrase
MPTTNLTDKFLRALKPDSGGKRRMIWDTGQRNLAVRVSETGKISFVVVRRAKGAPAPTWHVTGHYPAMGLKVAREAARDVRSLLMEGTTPKQVARQRLEQEQERQRIAEAQRENTFAAIADQFIATYLRHLRSAKRHEALIRTMLVPALGDTAVNEIRRRDIVRLVEEIAASRGPGSARVTLAVLSKFYNWCLSADRADVEFNPCSRIRVADLVGPAISRDRILNDQELKLVWSAAEQIGYPGGKVVQLLMLLGQRLNEIAACSYQEIDVSTAMLSIPASRMKNKSAHLVPLPPVSMQLLTGLPRFAGGDYVFSASSGRQPIKDFAGLKIKLDATIVQIAGKPIQSWVLHDLRRTCRSNLAALRIPTTVAEAVIDHRQRGVVGVYDRYQYLDERRAALVAWQDKLLSIVAA